MVVKATVAKLGISDNALADEANLFERSLFGGIVNRGVCLNPVNVKCFEEKVD
jgi:hypothetical protein